MKHFITSLVFTFLTATCVSMATGLDLTHTMLGCSALSAGLSLVQLPAGVAGAVVLKQMWETELIRAFRSTGDWTTRLLNKDQYVGNNVINMTEIGADPTLLINNSTYPISTAARVDDNIALALNKFDTTNTKVTRDELYALPYDKTGSVIDQHKEVIVEGARKYGLWNLAIAGNTATTPIVETTGAEVNGSARKAIKTADIILLKQKLDTLNAPKQGRCLVMCPQHIAELLLEDTSFQQRYQNVGEGKLAGRYMGFDIYEDNYNPVYTAANAKKAFGAAAAGTDRNASICFLASRAFMATGTTEMFYRDATLDPENRQTVVGFQLYNVIAPLKNTAFAAIVSDDLL